MKIKVFTNTANNAYLEDVLVKFAMGASEEDDVELSKSWQYEECDVAVFFGSWKNRTQHRHQLKLDIVKKAKNFVVLETPIIGRRAVKEILDDEWFRIGVNGFLRDTGDFNNKNRPPDRWKKIQKDLNVVCQPWNNNPEGAIVLALQLPGDASLQGTDISKWARHRIIRIRQNSDRKIILRTPQLDRRFELHQIIGDHKDVEVQKGTKENLIPTLREAFCSVSYSSGLGVDSLLAGCPTITYSASNFAYDASSNFILDIEKVERKDRTQWLNDLSYCQWNVNEIFKGKAWNHLKEVIDVS